MATRKSWNPMKNSFAKFQRLCKRMMLALPVVGMLIQPVAIHAQEIWSGADPTDDWTAILNWDGVAFPDGVGATAFFDGTSPAGPQTITLDAPITLGTLDFNVAGGDYTINGPSGLTFDNGGTSQLSIADGTLDINAEITLDDDLNADVISTAELSGDISGTGGLTKDGVGTLTLSGNNDYTGDTTVIDGDLELQNSAALDDGYAVIVETAGVLVVDDAETIGSLDGDGGVTLNDDLTTGDASDTEFEGAIGGTGGLTKEGTGTFTLSGINDYTGDTTVIDGDLELQNGAALDDANAVIVETDGVLVVDDAETIGSLAGDIGSGVTLNDDLTTGDASNTEFEGAISGTGGLTKEGTGTFTLSGFNTYSGGTTINDGILSVNDGSELGTGPLTFGGGELETTGGGTFDFIGDIDLSTDAIFDVTGELTLSGEISGIGGLTKEGVGTLELGNALNTYSGGTIIDEGVLAISNDANLGAVSGDLTFDGGTLLTTAGLTIDEFRIVTLEAGGGTIDTDGINSTVAGVITDDGVSGGALTKDGLGILVLNNLGNDYSGGTILNDGVLSVGNAGHLGDPAGGLTFNGGTLRTTGIVNYTGNVTLSPGSGGTIDTDGFDSIFDGTFDSTGDLTKQGAGMLTLSATNTYGDTFVNEGTLQAGSDDAFNSGNIAINTGGILDVDIFDVVLNAVTLTDGEIQGTTGTLTGQSFAVESGEISADLLGLGATTLTKNTGGTVTLSGDNSYTGGTFINGGILSVQSDGNLGDPNGGLTFNGGTLQITGAVAPFDSPLRTVTLTGDGTFDVVEAAQVATFNGPINGAGALTKEGAGTLTLSGNNSYGGGTFVNAGTLQAGSVTGLTGDIKIGTALTTGTLDLHGVMNDVGAVTLANGDIVDTIGGGELTGTSFNVQNGTISADLAGIGAAALTKTTTGTVTLSGTNSYSGATTVDGGTLVLNGGTALADDNAVIVDAGTLQIDADETIGSLDGAGGTVTLNANLTTGDNTEFFGVITGTGGLTKEGVGVLTLSGINSYGGSTLVNEGTLRAGSETAFSNNSDVTIANGSILDLNGNSNTVGAVTLIDGTIEDGTANPAVTLTGTSYVVQDGEISANLAGDATVTLTKTAGGGLNTVTLSGINTYSGGTTVIDGTLILGNATDTLLDTGAVTINGVGATLDIGSNSDIVGDVTLINGSITGTGDLEGTSFDVRNGAISANLLGAGAMLTKTTGNVVTLSGINNYGGGTFVNEGTLRAGSVDAFSGDITIGVAGVSAGVLDLGGNNNSVGAVTLFDGDIEGPGDELTGTSFDVRNGTINAKLAGAGATLTKDDGGTVTLFGSNSYGGGTFVNAGTLQAGSLTAFGSGDLTVNGGILNLNGNNNSVGAVTLNNGSIEGLGDELTGTAYDVRNGTISANLVGAAALTKTTGDVVTLSGDNSYGGGTFVNAGTLQAGNMTAFTGDITIDGGVLALTTFNNSVEAVTLIDGSITGVGDELTGTSFDVESGTISANLAGIGAALTKTNGGTVILSGTNTYTGDTSINGGVLSISADGNLGDGGELSFNGGTLKITGNAPFDSNRGVTLNGGGGTFDIFDATQVATLNGLITGTGALTKVGDGELVLTNTLNNYSGGTILNAGTLSVTDGSELGSGPLTWNAGTFSFTGGTYGGDIVINAATGTFDIAGSQTLSGEISGIGGLTKNGTGTLVLENPLNSYFGGTTINNGILSISDDGNLGDLTGDLTFNNGGTLLTTADITSARDVTMNGSGFAINTGASHSTFSGEFTGTGALTKDGSGTLTLAGSLDDFDGGISIDAGVLEFDTINGNIVYSGAIDGVGDLTKAGTGILTLGNVDPLITNTYSGDTSIEAGMLRLGGSQAIGDDSHVEIASGAIFNLNGFNETIGGLSGDGNVVLDDALGVNGSTLTVNDLGIGRIFNGSISGPADSELIKRGIGEWTLGGSNTFEGTTRIEAGTIKLGADNVFANNMAMEIETSGTFDLADNSDTIGALSGTGKVTLGTGTLTVNSENADATAANSTFSGEISGDGGLTKDGSGTFTLSSTNTYTGATTINAGTLRIGDEDVIHDLSSVIINGSTPASSVFDLNNFDEQIGSLAGTGGSVTLGSGTLITGGNDLFTEFSGVITGTGGLTKEGTETFTLSGSNDYSGPTTVNNGILELQNGMAVSDSSAVTVTDPGTLEIDDAETIGSLAGDGGVTLNDDLTTGADDSDTEFSGVITGTEGLTKNGTGTFTLSGSNDYSGPTTVNNGILELENGNALSDLNAVTVTTPGVLEIDDAEQIGSLAGNGGVTLNDDLTTGDDSDTEFSGVISGNGGLTKDGTGTFILSGINTYGGGTTVKDGILSISNDGNLGDAAGTLTFNGGTLLTTAGITSARDVTLNPGGGTIDTDVFNSTFSGLFSGNGDLTKEGTGTLTLTGSLDTFTGNTSIADGILEIDTAAASTSLTGDISGDGSLTKSGDNTLTLSGTNTYSGPTTVNGGILELQNGNALSNLNAVTVNTSGVLEIDDAETIGSLAGDGGVTLNDDLTTGADDSDTEFSGVISGTGGLTKDGDGNFTLSGTNTYSGDTLISDGTLTLGNATDTLLDTGAVTVDGVAAILDIGGNSDTVGIVTLIDGTIQNGTLFGTSYDVQNGSISANLAGTGALTKTTGGTVTLSGTNTYSGPTTVDGGILELVGGMAIDDLNAVTVNTSGVLQIDDTEIIGSLAGDGGVTLNADLITGGNDASTLFSGVLTGTGGLTKEGTGTFTLSGANTYIGGTTVNDGILSISDDGNLGDAVGTLTFDGGTLLTTAGITSARGVTLNAGGGTIDTNTFDSTFSGVFSGAGGLTKNGVGTLTLSGFNTYIGGTTVNDGILSISDDGNLGDAVGTLTFDGGTLLTTAGITSARDVTLNAGGGTIDTNSFDSAFLGDISGTGALNKNGLGTLTLDGVNTYTGDTTVNAGRLDVNGSTTSDTTVLNEATLGGNGTITGDVTIDAGGTMAPGNSIGQTNIVGNYTQNTGSTFELELRPVAPGTEVAGVDFDQTNVTGTATVNSGTTVNVIGEPGVYQLGSQYRFLQTTDGLTGSFDIVTGATFNNGLLQGTLFHDANNAELRITNTNFSSVFAAGTKNQQSVAAALDDLSGQVSNDPGSDGANVLNQLLVLPSAQMATAVQQIGGASLGADRLVALQSSFDYLQALKSRIRTGLVNNDRGRRDPIWVQGLGTFGNIDGNADSTGVDYTGSGIMFGIDQGLASGRQGISVGINQMDIDNQNGFDNSEIQSYNITAYTSTTAGPVYIMGVLGYGRDNFDSTRQLTMLDPDRTAAGSTSGNQLQALLEYGLYVNTPVWDTQVYISGQYVGLQQDDFTETGADSMNLSVDGRTTNSFRAAAGMRLAGRISEVFEPEFHAGIVHELLDPDSMTTAIFDGSTASFAQCGIQLPNTMAQLGVGATAKLGDSFSIFGGYDALLSGQQINHAISATGILNY